MAKPRSTPTTPAAPAPPANMPEDTGSPVVAGDESKMLEAAGDGIPKDTGEPIQVPPGGSASGVATGDGSGEKLTPIESNDPDGTDLDPPSESDPSDADAGDSSGDDPRPAEPHLEAAPPTKGPYAVDCDCPRKTSVKTGHTTVCWHNHSIPPHTDVDLCPCFGKAKEFVHFVRHGAFTQTDGEPIPLPDDIDDIVENAEL